MNWIVALVCVLSSYVLGMGIGLNFQSDKEVKKTEQKKVVAPKEKGSLAQKRAGLEVKGLINFPYHEIKSGRKIAEMVSEQLNLAEEVFEESERLRSEGKLDPLDLVGSVMVRSDLRNTGFILVMRKDQMAIEKPPQISYVINWDGKKWAVKDLPKKDKK